MQSSPDSSLQRTRLEKPTLVYPFEAPPAAGQTLEVSPGVVWMRMPMPGRLDHINAWALEDEGGWAVVDTGLHTEETVAVWRSIFAGNAKREDLAGKTLSRKTLTRVLATHMHPDHIGMAGWLTKKFNCRLWMSQLEYLNCRVLTADTGREAPADGLNFYHRAGWSGEAIERYQTRFGNYGKNVFPLPQSYRRVVNGEEIRIGQLTWRVVVGYGHSPEHACYYSEAAKLLISGDQVLPKISSNVSVYPTEPDANPMQAWLDSIVYIKAQVPDDVLVLPSHHDCFRGLHARLDYLAVSQSRSMERLLRTLQEPKRAIDVFVALFGRAIDQSDAGLLSLATGESLACLNYLLHRGEINRSNDDAGVAWYQAKA